MEERKPRAPALNDARIPRFSGAASTSISESAPAAGGSFRPGPEALLGRLASAFALSLFLVLGLDLAWDAAFAGRTESLSAALIFDLFVDSLALLVGLLAGISGWIDWKTEESIVSDAGLLRRRRGRESSVAWSDVALVPDSGSVFGSAVGMRRLTIVAGGRAYVFRGYPASFAATVTAMSRAAAPDDPADFPDPANLVALREDEKLEFKSTLRWSLREEKVDKSMELAVLKTIAGFMNASGGLLVIGVDDAGLPLGLARDFATLPKKSADGLENHVKQLVAQALGQRFLVFLSIRFAPVSAPAATPAGEAAGAAGDPGPGEICYVRVRPAPQPAVLRSTEGETFYLRTGNSTTALALSEAFGYLASGRFAL